MRAVHDSGTILIANDERDRVPLQQVVSPRGELVTDDSYRHGDPGLAVTPGTNPPDTSAASCAAV
jgi:hypothetical protein